MQIQEAHAVLIRIPAFCQRLREISASVKSADCDLLMVFEPHGQYYFRECRSPKPRYLAPPKCMFIAHSVLLSSA